MGNNICGLYTHRVTKGDNKARNQQRNWETIIQTFGILTQSIILDPHKKCIR